MSPRIRKIERVYITDQVVKELLSLIMSGDFKLEEKLPTESELCNHLGVGRSTVREALRVLSATGMIELRPGKGAYVVSNKKNSIISIQNWFTEKHAELDELIEVRMAIEPLALKLAIRRASNEEIQQI
ncbi:MAG: GntR family transcriptional regulator, partial [Sphaerochaetaceae bacterium]|nr:GntR family transcriptional regulator [Sphaerochaetaceae bacterium]